MTLLRILFLIAFLFPFVPGVFISDIQPFFIIIGCVCVAFSVIRRDVLILSILIIIYSSLFWDDLSHKVLAAIVGYVVTFEVCRKVDVSTVKYVLWLYFSVSLAGALIHYLNFELSATIRAYLSLRNSNYEYYSQLAPEPSMFYIQLIAIYFVLMKFDLRGIKLAYFVVSFITVSMGNEISIMLIVIPLLIEFCLLFLTRRQLFAVADYGAILVIVLYGIVFVYFPDVFYKVLEYFHRSEQVRLYDIGQVYYAMINNPLGVSDYREVLNNFSVDYPGRFKNDEYGSTSALSNVVYSIGLLGLLLFLFIVRFYFRYIGIFLLAIITTIGMSWFPLALLICRERMKNA